MENNFMVPFGSGTPSPFGPPNGSIFSAIKQEILDLLYHGQYLQAKQNLALSMIRANHEQKLAYIQVLKEIAASTTDDQVREQMFRDIWMLCAREA